MPKPKKPKPITGSQVVVPERLFAARERAKMTQFDVAVRVQEMTAKTVKLGPTEISRLETGGGFDILGSKLQAMARALNCSMDYLVGDSDKPDRR